MIIKTCFLKVCQRVAFPADRTHWKKVRVELAVAINLKSARPACALPTVSMSIYEHSHCTSSWGALIGSKYLTLPMGHGVAYAVTSILAWSCWPWRKVCPSSLTIWSRKFKADERVLALSLTLSYGLVQHSLHAPTPPRRGEEGGGGRGWSMRYFHF